MTSRKRKVSDPPISLNKTSSTITLTFGDQASKHAGMQKVGSSAFEGFTRADLEQAQKLFEEEKVTCELHNLVTLLPENKQKEVACDAFLLVIRNGVHALLKGGDGGEKDTKSDDG